MVAEKTATEFFVSDKQLERQKDGQTGRYTQG